MLAGVAAKVGHRRQVTLRVGKDFHIAEASFLRTVRNLLVPLRRGRENLSPRR